MGLEGVELTLELESTFEVSLSDADLGECRTPRQMIDLLSSKLREVAPKTCQSQRGFHLLRRSIIQSFGVLGRRNLGQVRGVDLPRLLGPPSGSLPSRPLRYAQGITIMLRGAQRPSVLPFQ